MASPEAFTGVVLGHGIAFSCQISFETNLSRQLRTASSVDQETETTSAQD
jgi:hypothetical protein